MLFLDSDILCTGDALSLFQSNTFALNVAPDTMYYQNLKREWTSFLPCPKHLQQPNKEYYDGFNSGVMLINYSLLSEDTFINLLKLLNPVFFSKALSGHTVQYLLNHAFKDNYRFIDSRYNFLLNSISFIDENSNITLQSAVFIHYIEVHKPWSTAKNIVTEPKLEIARNLWQQSYQSFKSAYNGQTI